ncbi:winged helix-turn-helix transcriptional regulator [Sulfolobus sp. S-194]|uniref:winged helix-turn-helix domain-containing protein n=1 Tax=Sulfolobus sp. S-194 TaxID=2512240 RepID=UPI0014371140|nr:winged helix-turn-helix domain-containing protein [Sulfolobus sp. S-194]QIW24670.1 winged helix-turn-helix transcriptional regulator [Sulfolobus sp. S-194]
MEDNFTRIVKDKTRREILIYLYNKNKATYSDILHDLNLSTGKLNYHLKILQPLISKEGEYYMLNEKGRQLVEIMLSLGDNKRESEYTKYISQFLAIISLIFLFIAGGLLSHIHIFYTIYSISIILLLVSAFFLYTKEVKGLENTMIFLTILFPYAFYLNGHIFVYSVLPAYLIVTSSVRINYYIYELIPTLIYYFGILPKFMNYNEKLMITLWTIILGIDTLLSFSYSYLIDLTPLLLGLSTIISRESIQSYKILFILTLAVIMGGTLFKMIIIKS